jgi:hypothetical protein
VAGVGGQAVWYSFSYAAMGGGRQAVCGMVATQGTNLVIVEDYYANSTPSESPFSGLINSLFG